MGVAARGLSAKQRELRLPEGFGLVHVSATRALAVEDLHEQSRAMIGHGPQRRHHRMRAPLLGERPEPVDLTSVCVRPAAHSGVAGREREEIDATEVVARFPQVL